MQAAIGCESLAMVAAALTNYVVVGRRLELDIAVWHNLGKR